MLLETLAARQRAAELLKTLERAQAECEGCLRSDERQDMMKAVTGKSSIESAIGQTRRMIEMLDRALGEAGEGAAAVEVVGGVGGLGGVGGEGGVGEFHILAVMRVVESRAIPRRRPCRLTAMKIRYRLPGFHGARTALTRRRSRR